MTPEEKEIQQLRIYLYKKIKDLAKYTNHTVWEKMPFEQLKIVLAAFSLNQLVVTCNRMSFQDGYRNALESIERD